MPKPMRRYRPDILGELQKKELDALREERSRLLAKVVDDRDLWFMLLSTVRYAMGRATYIVGEVAGLVRDFRERLSAQQLAQLAREIRAELTLRDERGERLGHEQDHQTWLRLVQDLEEVG